jgi:hypothetical protein
MNGASGDGISQVASAVFITPVFLEKLAEIHNNVLHIRWGTV